MRRSLVVAGCTGFLLALVAGSGPLNPPAGPVVATGATLDAIMAAVVGLQQQLPPRGETAQSLLPAQPVGPMTISITRSDQTSQEVPILAMRTEQATSTVNGVQVTRPLIVAVLDGHNYVDLWATTPSHTIHTGCPFTISGLRTGLVRVNTVQRADGTVNVLYEIVLDQVQLTPLAP